MGSPGSGLTLTPAERVNRTGAIEIEMDAECLPPHPWQEEPARDDFDVTRLRLSWNFLRNPRSADWSLTERPGWLRLAGSAASIDDLDSPAFVGRRQQHFECRTRSLVDFRPNVEGEEAGLTALANATHHYEIAIAMRSGRRCVIVHRRIGDLEAVVAEEPLADGPVTLQIQAEALKYTFSYAQGDRPMRVLAAGMTRHLSSEVASGFTGVYLGVYVTGHGKPSTTCADFDWFEYRPL